MNTLRIGIIGAGRIGRLHANNLKSRVPGAELVAVSDVYAPAAKAVAAALGIAAYGDYHDILSDPAVDAVFICSSTDTLSHFHRSRQGGQAHFLREAHRSRPGQDQSRDRSR